MRRLLLQRRGTATAIDERKSDYLHYRDLDLVANTLGEKHYFEGLGIDHQEEPRGAVLVWYSDRASNSRANPRGLVPDSGMAGADLSRRWMVCQRDDQRFDRAGLFPDHAAATGAEHRGDRQRWQDSAPQLVRQDVRWSVPDAKTAPKPIVQRQVGISKEHIDIVREGVRRVVHGPMGTAPSSGGLQTKWPKTNPEDEPQIMIGGKTGTAEIGNPDENNIYDRQHAWFTCFAPFDDPEIVVTAIVEDGGEGSAYAVPVVDVSCAPYFELTGAASGVWCCARGRDPMRSDIPVWQTRRRFRSRGTTGKTPRLFPTNDCLTISVSPQTRASITWHLSLPISMSALER